jgi:hypothetical protein
MRMRVRTTRDPISNQAGSSSTGGLPGELWVRVNPKVSPDRAYGAPPRPERRLWRSY